MLTLVVRGWDAPPHGMFGLSFQDRINKPNRLLSKIVNEASAGEVDVNGPSLIVTNPDPVVRVPPRDWRDEQLRVQSEVFELIWTDR